MLQKCTRQKYNELHLKSNAFIFFIAVCEGRFFFHKTQHIEQQQQQIFYLLFGDFFFSAFILVCGFFFSFRLACCSRYIAFRNLFYVESIDERVKNTRRKNVQPVVCIRQSRKIYGFGLLVHKLYARENEKPFNTVEKKKRVVILYPAHETLSVTISIASHQIDI